MIIVLCVGGEVEEAWWFGNMTGFGLVVWDFDFCQWVWYLFSLQHS
jgi:hypothetical protein